MHLIPNQEEVEHLLRETGALRTGHFEHPNGLHANEYLQIQCALRDYHNAKVLSVSLSRKLRANPEIRSMLPNVSIVAPAPAGLPVAYGICEALQAKRVYWTEEVSSETKQQKFRQFIQPEKGEQVILVDDILRSGRKVTELKKELEKHGAEVIALAFLAYQPTPDTPNFGDIPVYYLAKLEPTYYRDSKSCELCKSGSVAQKVAI